MYDSGSVISAVRTVAGSLLAMGGHVASALVGGAGGGPMPSTTVTFPLPSAFCEIDRRMPSDFDGKVKFSKYPLHVPRNVD